MLTILILAGCFNKDGQEDYAFGGIDLLDNLKVIHQIPVPKWVSPDLVMSNNPFFLELDTNKYLRFYFMPVDGKSTVYVYETNNEVRQ